MILLLQGDRDMKPLDTPVFADRREAGLALARVLAEKHLADPVVLALPRGGVPVAAEIARRLDAPLDVVLVRKIGVPYQRELAAAAVVDGGNAEIVANEDVMTMAGLAPADIQRLAKRELAEIERRRLAYLKGRERVPLDGRTLILVDDGIATGASVRAALTALRQRRPRALILAVPVAPADTIAALRSEVDDVICLKMPEPFMAIGLHYRDFHQLSDADVVRTLARARAALRAGRAGSTAA
jgi:putative phosphoribosyl transferase